jgi:hypothetical protein
MAVGSVSRCDTTIEARCTGAHTSIGFLRGPLHKNSEQAPAMPCAHAYPKALHDLRAQQPAVPLACCLSHVARRGADESNFELLQLRIGERGMSATMRLFAYCFYAALLVIVHPSLDTTRIIAKQCGDFVATSARSHEQHAMRTLGAAG